MYSRRRVSPGSTTQKRKELSQVFFRNKDIVRSFLAGLDIEPNDAVIEIGAGTGLITAELVRLCSKIIAIEKDPSLCHELTLRFGRARDVTIACSDFLELEGNVTRGEYKVVANIPYGNTSAIVRKLLSSSNPPKLAYLVMQREAANKFAGSPRESQFSVLTKPWFEIQIMRRFDPSNFVPEPAVTSALLSIRRRGNPLIPHKHRDLYRGFVRHGFGAWRKNLKSGFQGVFTTRQLRLLSANLNFRMNSQPTELAFEQWYGLFQYLLAAVPAHRRSTLLER